MSFGISPREGLSLRAVKGLFVERGSMRQTRGEGVGALFGGLSFFFFRSHPTGFSHFPAFFLPLPGSSA